MIDLKEIFDKDKRNLSDEKFVEQIDNESAIFSYYGQGFDHEGVFTYDSEKGWKFKRYYDRWYENLSEDEKNKVVIDIVNGLKKNGLTEITNDGDHITFSRKEDKK